MIERVKTGIEGLDDMLEGGVPAGRHVAIYGGPGAGKSSFCFEFVYKGAKMNENGLYISLEETPEDLVENMENTFTGMTDIRELMDKGALQITKPDKLTLEEVAELIENAITENNVKRVAIDSGTIIKYSFADQQQYRQTLFEFFSLLRNLDCTVFMILEAPQLSKDLMTFDVEHYVMDGIISIHAISKGDTRVRALEILKMRATNHSRDLVPFKITPTGIKVYVGEKVF